MAKEKVEHNTLTEKMISRKVSIELCNKES